jgi:hypothetical protein
MAQLCSTCQAQIIWAKTTKGRPMPLDLAKVAGGNIDLVDGVAHVVKPDGSAKHVSHFATCPNSASHRTRPNTHAREGGPTPGAKR